MVDVDTNEGNLLKDYAGLFAGAEFASDMFGAFYGSAQYRNELKIRKEERIIDKVLADSDFNLNMQALFNAQQDMKDKTTLELEAGRKEFQARQAELHVAASERGQEGQSIVDIHNDLSRTHENFKQLQLIQLGKVERDLMLKRQGIIDAHTRATVGLAVDDASGTSPFLSLLSTSPIAGINAITSYAFYRGETRANPDFRTKLEQTQGKGIKNG